MKILLEKSIILKLQLKNEFSIGDKVRISLLKNTFEKGYTSNWSEQIYIIDDINLLMFIIIII